MLQLPNLGFLLLDDLLIHEIHDPQRALPLAARIRSSQVFRNPPIVAPLNDATNRYMVLDGANRITALRKLGIPHAIAQIVAPDDPGLTLQNWNHVVWEYDSLRLIRSIRRIPGIRLVVEPNPRSKPNLWVECRLAQIQDCRGRVFSVCSLAESLEDQAELLSQVVAAYSEKARLDRTNAADIRSLADIYPSIAGLIFFPSFAMDDLLNLVSKGALLPAGITRFSIAPRALHLNYPLSALASDEPLETKNHALQIWIQERLARKQVRYYSEPTFSFDE